LRTRTARARTSGELLSILEEFATLFARFYLHYPKRRHASSALRAFADL